MLWSFTASAHAELADAVATLRAQNVTARDTADANDVLLDSAIRTIATQTRISRAERGGGGGGGSIRIKEQQRAEPADRANKERADKNKDKDKIKGKPQLGSPAKKTTTPQAEEHN
eukprot:jgi/Tetstr1/423236/TSEL_001354.t1